MTPLRKTRPRVVHFNVPRDWFEPNSRQKHYYEGGQKNSWVSRSTGKNSGVVGLTVKI